MIRASPKRAPVFGAADVENIRKACDVSQGQVIDGACKGGSHAGSVHEKVKTFLAAEMGQGFQFCFGVLGPDFRGIGDVDHLRLDHVLVGVKFQGLQDQIGGQFAVFCFHGQDFVSSGLNGSGLMDIDMAGLGGDHCLGEGGGRH